MEKLRWIEIKNYRGIKQAKLQNFGSINVIVGKNNTGKSTILESIYLNITASDPDLLGRDPIRNIFTRRGIPLSFPRRASVRTPEIEVTDVYHYLGYIFYREDIEEPVVFTSNINGYGLRVLKEIPDKILNSVLDYLERRYSRFKRIEFGMIHFLIVDSFERPLIIAYEELREERVSNTIWFMPRYYYANKTLGRRKEKKIILADTHWLFPIGALIPEEAPILTALKRLDRHTRISIPDLINFLSEQLGYDIVSIEPKLTDYYLVTENDELVPFSLLGDGTKMALAFFYILSLKESFILLEEPENHLHPKLMSRCIELMLDSSETSQIFITTHSLEFLQKVVERANERNADLRVFAITNLEKGIIEYESYNLSEAYAAVNKIGVDLR